MNGPITTTDLVWPATSFYWAVLEAPGYRRAGPLPPGLLTVMADEIPQPIDEVFAVGVPVEAGRVLACAARREELSSINASTRTLHPGELPPGVSSGTDLDALNLLVGEFEPAPLRRERHRRHRTRAAVTLLIAGLAVLGFTRRASHWNAVSEHAREAQRELVAQVWGEDAVNMPVEHAGLALQAELDRLRELARSRPTPPTDASVRLATLLNAWPANAASKPQSVSVNETGISVSVAVEGDPAPFLGAFKAPPGWIMDEPRLNSAAGQAGAITRLSLQLRPGQGRKDHP